MPEPKTLPDGSQLVVNVASLAEANALKKAVFRELVGLKIGLSAINLKELSGDEFDGMKDAVFRLLGSDSVESTLWTCARRSLYNGQPITTATFEDEKARENYERVAWEVMVYNLRPFFKSLLSLLPTVEKAPSSDQKSG